MKSVLTIAGSDPTGGAGFQADLKVFRAFGLHGLSVPAVLTAQNTAGVGAIFPLSREFFAEQMDLILEDVRPEALKTGMLYSPWVVEKVAGKIHAEKLPNLVVDPVSVSSSGTSLVDDGTLDLIRDMLFPLARVITPNIYEASLFSGISIETDQDLERAAAALKEMGPDAVVITGGHLEEITVDLYYDGNDFYRVESAKIKGEFHGTGCAFSAAVAAELAMGRTPLESARGAKEFVTEAIRKAYHPGRGMGILRI